LNIRQITREYKMTLLGEYVSVKEMTTIELNAKYLGVSLQELMESAGKSVADEVRNRFKLGSKIVVVSGLSGNGGDGFVAARHLASSGYDVEVYILGDPKYIHHENTKINYQVIEKMKATIKIHKVNDTAFISELEADVIIDGLIGTSMHGTLKTPYFEMVQNINKSKAYKVAIDIPTGMVADTGKILGKAIEADLTVTFHKPKQGFSTIPKHLGELIVAPIGIPKEAEAFTGPGDVWAVQTERKPDSYKGMFGTLLVVGGSETYSGAPALTSMGAYATGVDLVYSAVPETAAPAVMCLSPSLITVKLKGDKLNDDNLDQLKPFLEKVDAVAVGPGLGRHPDTVKTINKFFKEAQRHGLPMVIDADGLKAFAEKKTRIKTPTVFTPHSKEFQILTGKTVSGDFFERGSIVEKESKKIGAVILLKGRLDVISNGEITRYNWTGNPGMTVGGTGDVLTGIVAGYVAQGATLMEATAAAAFINGEAGDRVYREKGYHLLPEDLVSQIPYVVEDCLRE
jgi:NAD(P)H-hydrate epimerase